MPGAETDVGLTAEEAIETQLVDVGLVATGKASKLGSVDLNAGHPSTKSVTVRIDPRGSCATQANVRTE